MILQVMLIAVGMMLMLRASHWLAVHVDGMPKREINCTFCKNDLPVILAYEEDVNWNEVCTEHLETKARIKELEAQVLAVSPSDQIAEIMKPLDDWYKDNPDWRPQGRYRNTYIKPNQMRARHITVGDQPDELVYDIVDGYGNIISSTPARPKALAEPGRIYK